MRLDYLKRSLHSGLSRVCCCSSEWNSGSGGALRTLGVGPEDEVIVTPRSFVASVSSVVSVEATPIFADVNSNSGNICVEQLLL